MDSNEIKSLIIGILVFACAYSYQLIKEYKIEIEQLNTELKACNILLADTLVYDNTNTTEVVYIDKNNKNDNDVELSSKNDIKVKINDTSVTLPNNIKEDYKFENGKLVVEQKNTSTIDLSRIVNDLADAKGKQYSRTGKIDVGAIYNRKDKEIYGGIQYNAKAWNIGYYHSVNKSNDLIMFNYKF